MGEIIGPLVDVRTGKEPCTVPGNWWLSTNCGYNSRYYCYFKTGLVPSAERHLRKCSLELLVEGRMSNRTLCWEVDDVQALPPGTCPGTHVFAS